MAKLYFAPDRGLGISTEQVKKIINRNKMILSNSLSFSKMFDIPDDAKPFLADSFKPDISRELKEKRENVLESISWQLNSRTNSSSIKSLNPEYFDRSITIKII